MAIYTLKDIPDDLWREARKKAIDHEITMKDLLIQLLREWTGKNDPTKYVGSAGRGAKFFQNQTIFENP